MDYFCFDDKNLNYKKFVKSISNKILSKFDELNKNHGYLKSSKSLDKETTMFISQNESKKKLKQYVVGKFDYRTFKNYLKSSLELITIKNVEDEMRKYFKYYKTNIIEDRLNIGFKLKKDIFGEDIYLHEWCSLINKSDYDESRFYFTTKYITDENFNSLKGEVIICSEKNRKIIINFSEDKIANTSKFDYRIIQNVSLNCYIFFSSELKYETEEASLKNFLWKKGRFEKNSENYYQEENFQTDRNPETEITYLSGNNFERFIIGTEITEKREDWSTNNEKKENFKKINTVVRPEGKDSYNSLTVVICESEGSTRNEEHRETKDENGLVKKGLTKETFKDSTFSKGSNYYVDNHRKTHEEWWKNGNEIQTSIFEQNRNERKNEMSGYRMENEEKVYEFTDKYIENLEDHSNFSERSGYSKTDRNHWKNTTSTKGDEHLVEKWGKNDDENKEWYEKWFESKTGIKSIYLEKYSYKWGKDEFNEWKEEWKDVFGENGDLVQKTCYKTNKKFFDNYEWYETWNERFENNKLVEKNCQKWNKSDTSYFENKWGETLENREQNLWKNYNYFKRNDEEDSWVSYFNKVE